MEIADPLNGASKCFKNLEREAGILLLLQTTGMRLRERCLRLPSDVELGTSCCRAWLLSYTNLQSSWWVLLLWKNVFSVLCSESPACQWKCDWRVGGPCRGTARSTGEGLSSDPASLPCKHCRRGKGLPPPLPPPPGTVSCSAVLHPPLKGFEFQKKGSERCSLSLRKVLHPLARTRTLRGIRGSLPELLCCCLRCGGGGCWNFYWLHSGTGERAFALIPNVSCVFLFLKTVFLLVFSSKYYEREALLADPVCGPILACLLGKLTFHVLSLCLF